MLTALILVVQLAAAEDLAPRMAVLQKHFARLGAITVTADCETEKNAKLDDLKKALDAGADSVEEFNALYEKMDDVRSWLLDHSLHKPARAEGKFEDSADAWILTNLHLELRMNKSDFAITVKTPKETWRMMPCSDRDVDGKTSFGFLSAAQRQAEAFNTGYSTGMTLALSGFPNAPGFDLRLTINLIGNEVVFELAAPGDTAIFNGIDWPKPIEMANTAQDASVVPHMQGVYLPGNWPDAVHTADLCNSRTLYMPWWGQIRNGHGVQTILETSYDAGAAIHHNAGGPTTIQPRWYSSMGKVGYQRVARYVFDDEASHVSFAKRYRQYAKESGNFVSLNEKRVRTPNVNEVIGRPVIHLGALYHFVKEASLRNKDRVELNHDLRTFDELMEQLRAIKANGIEDAYVHLDGWGFYGYDSMHPDPLPVGEEQGGWEGLLRFAKTCEELGYLFAVHDQYRDFYFNAVSFDDRLSATRLDGSREEHATWCGGRQTILSAQFAPEYVRRNHDLFAQHGVPVKGAYLDVFSVVPPEECHQPAHPVTRSECAQYRRECFAILRARGYVVSSEEPTDYLVASLDLVHHGPYPLTGSLGGGNAVGIPVPLFNLVYHDSLLTPWDMGEDGGWGIPKGDAGRLHCLLNAGLPYVGPGADATMVERVNQACELSKRCATLEMVNHEFLDESRRKQRTTFSDGTQVTVDFDARTGSIQYPK